MKANIWSISNSMWWKPNGDGYTPHIEEAGLYELEEAEKICASSPEKDEVVPADRGIEVRQRRSIHALLLSFKDGEKRMMESARFHMTMRMLEAGADPMKIIDQLIIDHDEMTAINNQLLKERRVSRIIKPQ